MMEFGRLGAVAQELSIFVPVSVAQLVGDVLNESGHHVLARRRQRGIHVRGDDAIHPQLLGNFTELGDVVASFGEFQ
jgi:hypothetical protein